MPIVLSEVLVSKFSLKMLLTISIRKLLSLSFDKYIKLQLWLCCMSNCIPYYVKDNRLQGIKSGLRKLIHRLQMITHAIYLTAMIAFMSNKVIQGNRLQTNELMGVVFISLNFLCFVCRFNFTVYNEEGAKLVNMILKLSETNKGNITIIEWLI